MMYYWFDHPVEDEFAPDCYDLSDESFKLLIQTCIKYCAAFSVRIYRDNTDGLAALESFCIPLQKFSLDAYSQYQYRRDFSGLKKIDLTKEIRLYRVCPELYDAIMQVSDSLFEWCAIWEYNNPEDPIFYRKDGSVFFYSCIHEGESFLNVRPDEDVDALISAVPWGVVDDTWPQPCIPPWDIEENC